MSKPIFIYEVHRQLEVEKQDVKGAVKFIRTLELMGKDARQRACLIFHGYDHDNRELYEIKEVRAYLEKLFKKVPHLFYFIEQEIYENQQLLLACLCDIHVFYQGEKLSPMELEERGYTWDTLPRAHLRIHLSNRLWAQLKAELRKFARLIGDKKAAEEIIREMEERYGIKKEES